MVVTTSYEALLWRGISITTEDCGRALIALSHYARTHSKYITILMQKLSTILQQRPKGYEELTIK